MADAPDTATYLLVTNTGALPQARAVTATGGLTFNAGAPGGTAAFGTDAPLSALEAMAGASGYVAFNTGANPAFVQRVFGNSATVTLTNPSGSTSSPTTWNVTPNTTVQQIQVNFGGVLKATRSNLTFVQGAGIVLNVEDLNGAAQVSISATGGGGGGSITLDTSSGLLITGSPGNALTVDLPGSIAGPPNAVAVGDMLIGIAGAKYGAVGIAGSAGQFWGSNGTTGSWTTAPGADITLTQSTGLVIEGSPGDDISIDLPGSVDGSVALGDMMVGGPDGEYIGKGIGAEGDQWTVVDGTGKWVTPTTAGVGPSGTGVFDTVFVPAPFANLSYKFYPDTNVTSGTVVTCSPFANKTGAPEPAEMPFAVTDPAPAALGNGVGYYIFSGITTAGALVVKGFSYVVVKY